MKGICPVCESIQDIEIVSKSESRKIRGKKVTFSAEYTKCLHCGNEFASNDQMDQTLINAYKEYRIIENIISPEEIIHIRHKYDVSQKALAKILDLGDLTINSYEQGALPSKSVSNLIRFIEKEDNFIELFQNNKMKLSKLQITKIENKLSKSFVVLSRGIEEPNIDVTSPYSGYNIPSIEKLVSLLQLILYFSKKKLYKMALLKIAFYTDFVSFRDTVRSISGWPYAALPHGPVPNDWKAILFQAEKEGLIESEPDNLERGDLFYIPKSTDIQAIKNQFNSTEIGIIKETTTILKDKTATELRKLSHQEEAWINTEQATLIDYSLAQNLKNV